MDTRWDDPSSAFRLAPWQQDASCAHCRTAVAVAGLAQRHSVAAAAEQPLPPPLPVQLPSAVAFSSVSFSSWEEEVARPLQRGVLETVLAQQDLH